MMHIDNETIEALASIRPLQQKLKDIMSDKDGKHHTIARMPFSVTKYGDNDYSVISKRGAITYNTENNTYFDSSFYALTKVAQDCLKVISYTGCPKDELYQHILGGLDGIGSIEKLIIPQFKIRDRDIDEKNSYNHSYISNSINFASGDCNLENIYNIVTLSNIFTAFTLLIDEDRPFMKEVHSTTDNYIRLIFMIQFDTIKFILEKFTTIADMDYEDIYAD